MVVAQTMTEIQRLDFGGFALRNNTSAHTIVIAPNNSVSYAAAFVPDGATPAHRGEYSLTGMPPNMALTFGVTTTNNTDQGGTTLDNGVNLSKNGAGAGPLFTVGSYTANSPSTNGSGSATLFIGGTLTTSGTGAFYTDGSYAGSVDITIYF